MVRFDERLWPPLWWWPVLAVVVAGLGTEVYAGLPAAAAVATDAVLAGAAAALLLRLGSTRLRVQDQRLLAGPAQIELRHLARAQALDETQTRRRLGPEADPLAFVVYRWWIRTSVVVDLADPDDDTPYWLVSTRRPQELVAALRG